METMADTPESYQPGGGLSTRGNALDGGRECPYNMAFLKGMILGRDP